MFYQLKTKPNLMNYVNTMSRELLEFSILEHGLECHFGGLAGMMQTDTEDLREALTQWIIDGSEDI